jgi:hypothetical protein
MKKKAIFLSALISCGLIFLLNNQCVHRDDQDKIIFIENGKIKVGFEKSTGKLVSFAAHEYIDPQIVDGLPWEVRVHPSSNHPAKIGEIIPSNFRYSKPDPFCIRLKWRGIPEMKGVEIEAEISLDQNNALSYWKINIKGAKGKQIAGVVFPKISGIKELGKEKLVVPAWTGELMDDPRCEMRKSERKLLEYSYPGQLSSQVFALYNPDKCGFYASSNDSMSYAKSFVFALDTCNSLIYEMINYPEFNSAVDSYSSPYAAVLGSFKGDWITMSEIYRDWAIKQKWAAGSRLGTGLIPSWLENTDLWIWNRGRSGNVLKPAVELSKVSGLSVSVLWHWWHNNSYDDNLPEYLPPREGRDSFKNAVISAKNKGVRAIVYMNAIQWGESSMSWKTENVMPYTVKNINGNTLSHIYNIFTGNALTTMCIATPFWRNRYTSLCDCVINIYRTSGVYMDQACLNYRCYDKDHGHTPGGGNYWVESFGKLTGQIRSEVSGENQPALAGEGSGESWLPFLDAFLTLQSSRERYAGVGNIEPIPLFQAIYHPYAITFGSYSSLVTPPYDEKWPEKFAPEKTEQLMDEAFNKQFLMEQARSFVWGNQPTIANYHSFLNSERRDEINYLLDIARLRSLALKYLLHGEFCRNPEIEYPEEKIKISKLSIYAGRSRSDIIKTFEKNIPLLYTGTWKAKDNSIGIALASISDEEIPLSFRFSAKDYDLPPRGKIYKIISNGKEFLNFYKGDSVNVSVNLQPRSVCLIEAVPSE